MTRPGCRSVSSHTTNFLRREGRIGLACGLSALPQDSRALRAGVTGCRSPDPDGIRFAVEVPPGGHAALAAAGGQA